MGFYGILKKGELKISVDSLNERRAKLKFIAVRRILNLAVP